MYQKHYGTTVIDILCNNYVKFPVALAALYQILDCLKVLGFSKQLLNEMDTKLDLAHHQHVEQAQQFVLAQRQLAAMQPVLPLPPAAIAVPIQTDEPFVVAAAAAQPQAVLAPPSPCAAAAAYPEAYPGYIPEIEYVSSGTPGAYMPRVVQHGPSQPTQAAVQEVPILQVQQAQEQHNGVFVHTTCTPEYTFI